MLISTIASFLLASPAQAADGPGHADVVDAELRLEASAWRNVMDALDQSRDQHQQTPNADRLFAHARAAWEEAQEAVDLGDDAHAARELSTGWRASHKVLGDFFDQATPTELSLVATALQDAGRETAAWLELWRGSLPDDALDRLDAAEDELGAARDVQPKDPRAAAQHSEDGVDDLERALRDLIANPPSDLVG